MDLIILFKWLILPLICAAAVGVIIGYLLRWIIDDRKDARRRLEEIHVGELIKQVEWLTGFVGFFEKKYLSLIDYAEDFGHLQRKWSLDLVQEYIQIKKKLFPGDIQDELAWFDRAIDSMRSDEGLQEMQEPEAVEEAQRHFRRIEEWRIRLCGSR